MRWPTLENSTALNVLFGCILFIGATSVAIGTVALIAETRHLINAAIFEEARKP